jgi:ABC-type transport system involved in Fe-S cluster assembly fused permease/ATPase subunit
LSRNLHLSRPVQWAVVVWGAEAVRSGVHMEEVCLAAVLLRQVMILLQDRVTAALNTHTQHFLLTRLNQNAIYIHAV